MDDPKFNDELDRRLRLLESPESPESLPATLPTRDIWMAVSVLVVLVVVLLWWGYPA